MPWYGLLRPSWRYPPTARLNRGLGRFAKDAGQLDSDDLNPLSSLMDRCLCRSEISAPRRGSADLRQV